MIHGLHYIEEKYSYDQKSTKTKEGVEKTVTCVEIENGYLCIIEKEWPKPEDEREHEYEKERDCKVFYSSEDPMKKIENSQFEEKPKEGDLMENIGDMTISGNKMSSY